MKMDDRASVDQRRRRALLVVVALAVVAAIGTVSLSEAPQNAPTWTFPPPGPSNAAPSPAPTAATPVGDWAPLQLPPYTPVARLVATSFDAAGVAVDTAFRLTSLSSTPAMTLAGSLEVTPKLDLTATPSSDGSMTIVPHARLVPGTAYRFTAHAPDGSLAGTWSFQAARPLGIAVTIPGNQATAVPLDSGIEITFDQDGVTGASDHFGIEPATDGRFEQHGRTLVFVPASLKPLTLYTVTISRGVGLTGSGQVLESDVRFAFETGGPTEPSAVQRRFQRAVIEAPTTAAPILAFTASGPSAETQLAPFTVDVYRLGSLEKAAAVSTSLMRAPTWASWSTAGQIGTSGLPRVLRASLRPRSVSPGDSWNLSVSLPAPLPAGWYLVDEPEATGRHAQATLQVTDVSTFALFTATDALFWLNDLATGTALGSTRIDVLDGPRIGTTGEDGLLRAPVPGTVRAAAESVGGGPTATVIVTAPDGRRAFVPVGEAATWGPYIADTGWGKSEPDPWWSVFAIDRTAFRSIDVANAWGFLRPRDGGPPPREVELRLVTTAGYWMDTGESVPAIESVTVRPDANGAFDGRVPIRDLPLGEYELQMLVDGTVLDRAWLRVDVIRKPSYQLTVETDRHVYFEGDRATIAVGAAFFDGTPVPGTNLRLSGWAGATVSTGARGRATTTQTVTVDACCRGGIGMFGINATATDAEEGSINAGTSAIVFASHRWLGATATATATRGTVTGTLSALDVERLERDWATVDWQTDPAGAPIPGGEVGFKVVEFVPVLERTDTTYDFIVKRTISTPVYTTKERIVRDDAVRTDAAGRFTIDVPIASNRTYEVRLSATDEGGHSIPLTVQIPSPESPTPSGSTQPDLAADPTCVAASGPCVYAISAGVSRTMSDVNGALPSGGMNRYLFATMQGGLRDVGVETSSTFRRTFRATDVPDIGLLGVRFTGTTYTAANPTDLLFDASSRKLEVRLTTDRERYAPGDAVGLAIRTLDATGVPMAASVALRVIDEKLYASGQADEADPLSLLYRRIPWGLVRTYASHPLPIVPWGGGKGDTTGGGGRGDFRDFLVARLVTTDADGRATTTFTLSDDLTAWHVSASALTADERAGTTAMLVPVGLPFFVEAPVAPEYIVGERPILRVRAYGSGLTAGDPVMFTVSSSTLPMTATTVSGVAFEPVAIPLPALPGGAQTIRIAASGRHAGSSAGLADAIIRTFDVIESRFTATRTSYETLVAGPHPDGGPSTSYVFTDAGRVRFVPALQSLAWGSGARVDQALAAAISRDLLVRTFRVSDADLPPTTFDPYRYQHDDLVALLPYASGDLALTARLALLAPQRFDTTALRRAFTNALADSSRTREQKVLALAGLAGLGDPVIMQVRAALADPALTIRERLSLALGAATLGDAETAIAVERDLLGTSGEQLGPMIRLRVGTSRDDTVDATALVALIAATAGDPVAAGATAYLESQPGIDQLSGIEQAVTISRMVERMPAAQASFAYTVGGEWRVVQLVAGEAFSLTLTATQRATLSFEPLTGSVGVATTWRMPVAPGSIAADPSVALVRTALPAGVLPVDGVVEVRLTATFGPEALAGSYEVTELVPSGLAPLPLTEAWPPVAGDGRGEATATPYFAPYAIDGQRVSFSVTRPAKGDTVRMRYLARVVTGGTYAWEPALMQALGAAESSVATPATTITIR